MELSTLNLAEVFQYFNISSSCTQVDVENGPNRSKNTPTVPRKLRSLFLRSEHLLSVSLSICPPTKLCSIYGTNSRIRKTENIVRNFAKEFENGPTMSKSPPTRSTRLYN